MLTLFRKTGRAVEETGEHQGQALGWGTVGWVGHMEPAPNRAPRLGSGLGTQWAGWVTWSQPLTAVPGFREDNFPPTEEGNGSGWFQHVTSIVHFISITSASPRHQASDPGVWGSLL